MGIVVWLTSVILSVQNVLNVSSVSTMGGVAVVRAIQLLYSSTDKPHHLMTQIPMLMMSPSTIGCPVALAFATLVKRQSARASKLLPGCQSVAIRWQCASLFSAVVIFDLSWCKSVTYYMIGHHVISILHGGRIKIMG